MSGVEQSTEIAPRWSRFVCRIRGHRFDGWSKHHVPFEPLPWARCGRCGRKL